MRRGIIDKRPHIPSRFAPIPTPPVYSTGPQTVARRLPQRGVYSIALNGVDIRMGTEGEFADIDNFGKVVRKVKGTVVAIRVYGDGSTYLDVRTEKDERQVRVK